VFPGARLLRRAPEQGPPESDGREAPVAADALIPFLTPTRVALFPLLAGMVGAQPSADPVQAAAYEVYAVRYGTIAAFPVAGLVAGADTARRMDIAMMVWVLKAADGRVVLVDAGFYRQKFLDQWKPASHTRPSDALAALGIAPGNVTDIVVTHVHWDHVDGVDLFPNARIWLQRDEYEYYVRDDGNQRAIDPDDAKMLAEFRAAGRVALVDGDGREIIPGITVYTGGKHTYASQYVGVRTAAGTVVVASDNCYLYENLERRAAIAQTLDAASNLAAQDRMRQLAGEMRLIVPGHDPAVFERFPEPGRGVAKIE
jgi:glyoxylase-like metal-dependent hydrolase (beta-lactamase superfamily II)